jgi:hypothetical protein
MEIRLEKLLMSHLLYISKLFIFSIILLNIVLIIIHQKISRWGNKREFNSYVKNIYQINLY